jgi:NAD(P)-dependent dehydrogenase (short-subunit alcohol dehydrogenase family)
VDGRARDPAGLGALADLIRLDGRVAGVTGGAGGIGQKIVEFLADSGASVVIVDRNVEPAAALVDRLGSSVTSVEADLSAEAEVERVVGRIVERHGRIDIWCNNAGIGSSSGANVGLLDTTEEEWERIVRYNLTSVGFCCKHVLPVMEAAGAGSIVNTSSISGVVGTGSAHAYHASKAGVGGLTRALAVDWAPKGIRVNAVCPGSIDTPMYTGNSPEVRAADVAATPIGRIGRPE